MTTMITAVGAQLKEGANPFVRLVWQHTADDGNPSVTHFQTEQIKDAVFQSDYACQWVHQTLIKQLESRSPVVIYKALWIIRILMMEGPATFNQKMGSQLGRIVSLTQQETFKNTVEDDNKKLAIAIHQACTGNSAALFAIGTGNSHDNAAGSKPTSYKTDYQVAQEREAKAFKKRKDDEKRAAETVVSERVFDSFDSSLPAAKLVQQAVASAKKKFAPEEIRSFVDATTAQDKPGEVAQQLDLVLKDFKNPLATRYKLLTLIEGLVETGEIEVLTYFNKHTLGLQRHTQLEASDNPTKAQQSVALAQKILQIVSSWNPTSIALASKANPSSTTVSMSAPVPTANPGVVSSSNVGRQRGASTVVAPSSAAAAPPTFSTFGVQSVNPVFGNLDDMFADMHVKSAPGNGSFSSGSAAAAPQAFGQPPMPAHFGQPAAPATQPTGWGTGGGASWGQPAPYAPAPPQPQPVAARAPAPQQQPPAFDWGAQQASYGPPPTQQQQHHHHHHQQPQPAPPQPAAAYHHHHVPQQPAVAPPPAAPGPDANQQAMMAMMEQMQRNMMAMQQMMFAQPPQQQQPQPAAPPNSWGSTASAPPPLPPPPPPAPVVVAPTTSSENGSRSGSVQATPSGGGLQSAGGSFHDNPARAPSSEAAAPVAAPPAAAPAVNQASSAPSPDAIAALTALQQQMAATQQILAQQQAMFLQLSAQLGLKPAA